MASTVEQLAEQAMRYEFHPEALEEYGQAALWYAEREPEIALQFIGSVEDHKASC